VRRMGVVSDQLTNWSDHHEELFHCPTQEKAESPCKETPAPPCHPSRLTHRTIQALWKARLQVCAGARAWPEVLPLGELSRIQTPDGLRPSGLQGASGRAPRPLLLCSGDPGRNLQHQHGALASKGKALGNTDGYRCRHHGDDESRDGTCWNSRGQHGPRAISGGLSQRNVGGMR